MSWYENTTYRGQFITNQTSLDIVCRCDRLLLNLGRMEQGFPDRGSRALVVQVYCYFRNCDGNAHLDVDISQEGNEEGGVASQEGNEEGGVASVETRHHKVYADTFYYEVFVPWGSLTYYLGSDQNFPQPPQLSLVV